MINSRDGATGLCTRESSLATTCTISQSQRNAIFRCKRVTGVTIFPVLSFFSPHLLVSLCCHFLYPYRHRFPPAPKTQPLTHSHPSVCYYATAKSLETERDSRTKNATQFVLQNEKHKIVVYSDIFDVPLAKIRGCAGFYD